MTYEIRSFRGVGPIEFDMDAHEVELILGPPDSVVANFIGERDESRGRVSVRYSRGDEKVVELAFLPGESLLFRDISMFDDPDLVHSLMRYDPSPVESHGFLIYPAIGITLTGFHDQDESQKAITVFRRGRWDEFLSQAVPYRDEN